MSRAIERIRAALREPRARPTADASEGNGPEPMHASAEGIADAVIVMCRTLVEPRKSIVHLLRSWKAAVPLRPDAAVASASVVDIAPSANLPKLIQPPESPGWRGDATVTAFRERLELRIRETVDQVARVAGHAPGAQLTLKRFDRFLDCLCDAAAGAALAAAPRDAGREEAADLMEMLKDRAWEIDADEDEWIVRQLTGSPNDREWRVVGRGETWMDALRAARRGATS